MTFDLNDLKTAIISIGVFFICIAIQRYWSKRNIKSLKCVFRPKSAPVPLANRHSFRSKSALVPTQIDTLFRVS